MLVAFVKSTTFTLTCNHTFFDVVEVFGSILEGLAAISSHTEIESLVSILDPTMGTLLSSWIVALQIIGEVESL